MKLGTENKTKTAIAGGLVIVAAFALYNWVFSSQDAETATAAATVTSAATAAQKPGKPAARKGPNVVLAQSLDPTLRLGLAEVERRRDLQGFGARHLSDRSPSRRRFPKKSKR